MKKLLLVIAFLPIMVVGQFHVPNKIPNTFVFDYDGVLNAEQKQEINNTIINIEKKSTVEIAVIVLSDLQGDEIEDVSLQFGRAWGVGKKELNNGIVYLIAPQLHKGRMDIGYGLEGDLPDVLTSQMQDKVKPFYRQGDYYSGIMDILGQINTVLTPISAEERAALQQQKNKQTKENAEFTRKVVKIVCFSLLFLIFTAFVFVYRYHLRKQKEKQKRIEAEKLLAEQKKKEKAEKDEKLRLQLLNSVKNIFNSAVKNIDFDRNQFNIVAKEIGVYPLSIKAWQSTFEEKFDKLIAFIKTPIKDSFSTEKLNSIISEYYSYSNQLRRVIDNFAAEIDKYKNNEKNAQQILKNLPILHKKAATELKNTPYKTLKEETLAYVVGTKTSLWNIYDQAFALQQYYNDIINYQANEQRKKDEQLAEEKRRKQRLQDEEDERQRRNSNSYSSYSYLSYSSNDSSSSYDNSSSYSSSSSDSSSSSGDYGGGSFGGGGSSSDW